MIFVIMISTMDLSSYFWSPKFWLMDGLKWQDVQPRDEYDYTDYRHLYLFPIPLAVIMLMFRFMLEKYCFYRLGLSLGMRNIKCKKAPPNPVLEKAYKISSKWNHKDIVSLSKQTDCTERQIERWLRLRKMQEKPSVIFKFSECCWRCFYYTNIFLYGLTSFWGEPWIKNLNNCWVNYPHQELSPEVWWFYMISLAFYTSIFISQVLDARRRDFWHTTLQHIVVSSLLIVSWISNLYRIGVTVLLLHDISDALVQMGKAVKYAKSYKICAYIFFLFVCTWTITRLILYPFWMLPNTLFKGPTVLRQTFPAYHFLNGLLITLLLIHIYKSYLILRIFMKTFSVDKLHGDNGSDSSEDQQSKFGK